MKVLLVFLISLIIFSALALAVEVGVDSDVGVAAGANRVEARSNSSVGYSDSNRGTVQARLRASNLTVAEIRAILQERNRLRVSAEGDACPTDCSCDGSTMRCELNGSRQLTVRAGNSGNVIFITRDVNASTNVTLYAHNRKVFAHLDANHDGMLDENETAEIAFPDEVKARIRERINARLENENITLGEDGYYGIQARKRARLFWMFPVKEMVHARVDAETGEVIEVRNSWWGFMARDEVDVEADVDVE